MKTGHVAGLAAATLFLSLSSPLTLPCRPSYLGWVGAQDCAAAAQPDERQTASILEAADSFFKAMKVRDYTAVWSGLSEQSRKTIVEKVFRTIREDKQAGRSVESITQDFAAGGPIARAYWSAYLSNFDPDTILEQSRWTMGTVRQTRAEILLLHRKSENAAVLKMVKEGGEWKVGLMETFGRRK